MAFHTASIGQEKTMIVLNLPKSEIDSLINSIIIDKVILGGVTDSLYIFIKTDQSALQLTSKVSDSSVFAYISQLYELVWDFCLLRSKLTVKCFISSDMGDSFPSLHTWLHQLKPRRIFLDLSSHTVSQEDIALVKSMAVLDSAYQLEIGDTNTLHELNAIISNNKVLFFEDTFGTGHNMPMYDQVAIGGTFDRMHNGHRKLLSFAISVCKTRLVIGVTGDSMLKAKANAAMIASFEDRRETLRSYINLLGPHMVDKRDNTELSVDGNSKTTSSEISDIGGGNSGEVQSSASSVCGGFRFKQPSPPHFDIVQLSDPFGPTTAEASIEAIVVSSETLAGAAKINSIRREKGMAPLDILVTRRGGSATLSSTFIRGNT